MFDEDLFASYDIDERVMKSIEDGDAPSKVRYHTRIAMHRNMNFRFPRLRHHFWWMIHNCVAHILIGIMPFNIFFRFHDWTSDKINVK